MLLKDWNLFSTRKCYRFPSLHIKEVLHVINHSVLLLCKLSFVCKKIEDIFLAALFPDDEVLWFSSVLKDQ